MLLPPPLTEGTGIGRVSATERSLRCYLMKNGHIATVEFLTAGSDEVLIEQGHAIFRERMGQRYDGFEVWDGARRVFVHPEEIKDQNST